VTGRAVGRTVVVVGSHPPQPTPSARLCARLGVEHARAGAHVVTVDRLPSAAERTVPLRGLAGAAAVAWLARRADHLELVIEPALLQRAGARSPEHRAVAAAWCAALRVPGSARVHVLDPIDVRQLGLHFDATAHPGLEVVEHIAEVSRSTPAGPAGSGARGVAAPPEPTWESFAAAVALSASADRLAGIHLRLPTPTPPPAGRDQAEPAGAPSGRGGRAAAGAVLGVKRLALAARAALAGRRRPLR